MKTLLCALFSAAAIGCHAAGLEDLEAFIANATSGKAQFSQVVTAPGKDLQTSLRKTSSGTFSFLRPNRFKFVYEKPFSQTIVADGQTLWLFDPDLNQVIARNQAAVLGATPAALIASAPDSKALKADFQMTAAPEKDGLQWVLATPKANDSPLESVRIGMKGAQLAVLEIVDSFGQRSVITFSGMQINAGVDAAAFVFKPPAGADVIRQ